MTLPQSTAFRLVIEGIEATQATQFYKSHRHLDCATAEQDHRVPLVAGKLLAVRVYPDVRSADGPLVVDGELWFSSHGKATWQKAHRFSGRVLGRPAATIQRGDAQQTLNFRIPGTCCRGTIHLRTRISVDSPGGHRRLSEWHETSFAFVEVPPLRLRLFGVRYRRGGLDLEPPSASDALQTLSFARKTFPVSDIEIENYEIIQFSGDLSDVSPHGCSRGWGELLVLLSRLRTASLGSAVHYALLPTGIEQGGYAGFGSALGVGASCIGYSETMAQELGHILQLDHAPGRGAPCPDPMYPSYGRYPPGSIGEYGFDPASGLAYSPRRSRDLMGYGRNLWVSPYTYRNLMAALRRAEQDARESTDDRIFDRRLHLGTRSGGHNRDAEGSPQFSFPPGVPGESGVPQQKLQVKLTTPSLKEAGQECAGELELNWQVVGPTKPHLIIFLRYSNDGGTSWRSVNLGFDWGHCQVNVDWLPGGEDCRLQLIACTQLQAASAETIPFRVRRKARRAEIVTEVATGNSSRSDCGPPELTGIAFGPGDVAGASELAWSSDLQGPLGYGSRLALDELIPGEHEITLYAPDGMGGNARARTRTRVK